AVIKATFSYAKKAVHLEHAARNELGLTNQLNSNFASKSSPYTRGRDFLLGHFPTVSNFEYLFS
ncbi:hypothetical protein ACJX0J_019016, partial [Zea mays]